MAKKSKPKIKTKPKKKILLSSVVQLIIMAGLLLLLPSQNKYAIRAQLEEYVPKKELTPPTPAPYPININQPSPPELTAVGVMIVDVPSRVILYEKNPQLKLLPASTTKIMTALVVLEDYHLDDVVTVDTIITDGQTMELVKGESMTVENLLYGVLVNSANDAAYALAEHHQGGVDAFVDRMNQLAQKYHLEDTRYENPIGFDHAKQVTTARDLARLSRVALKQPTLVKMVGVPQITVSDTLFTRFHYLTNINELVGKVPGVSGFKTGWTENAGQSLVTTVMRNNREILIVLLNSEDRFGETEVLLDWAFNNHRWQDLSPDTNSESG